MNKTVDGKDKTLRNLLSGAQYSIDYYQRDYKWETKQVNELIDDLAGKFLQSYHPDHARQEIANYPAYFLGSVILSRKDSSVFIVDGQQRLTTVTLLLIFLRNLQLEMREIQDPNLEPLILSTQYGQSNFNIHIEERDPVIRSLYEQTELLDLDEESPLQNILSRYEDIADRFPDECKGHALAYFIDWLIERVQVVEISAYSDDDAYTIFETMNDRGLSLTPADMLKGYVLSNIRDKDQRKEADQIWRTKVPSATVQSRDTENDFFRTWFRGRYGKSVGTTGDDYERLGPEFHRWLRDHAEEVNLSHSDQFASFSKTELPFYAHWYTEIKTPTAAPDTRFPALHFVSRSEAAIDQGMLLISPLASSDVNEVNQLKLDLTSRFLDIFIARRIWAVKNITNPALKGTFVPWARNIRKLSPNELAAYLYAELTKAGHDNFETEPPGYLSPSRKRVHRLLARLTHFVEASAGDGTTLFSDLIVTTGRNKYEIEHIWPNDFERERDSFDNEQEFRQSRNRLGGLLLLPGTFNSSYSDMKWQDKIPKYSRPGHNLLAASLDGETYENNPRFVEWTKASGLNFQPYGGDKPFDRGAIDERTELYRSIARLIWAPDSLLQVPNIDVEFVKERAQELLAGNA